MFAAFNTPNRGSNVSNTHVVDPFTFFSATTWNARSSINNGWVVDFEASEEDDEAERKFNVALIAKYKGRKLNFETLTKKQVEPTHAKALNSGIEPPFLVSVTVPKQ